MIAQTQAALIPILDDMAPPELQCSMTLLERTLGSSCRLWVKRDDWRALTPFTQPNDNDRTVIGNLASLDLEALRQQPVVAKITDMRHLVVIPLTHPNGTLYAAVTTVEGGNWELVAQLAHTAHQLVLTNQERNEHEDRINDYARHLSADLEQLVWLRDLPQYVEGCDPRETLESIAEQILPALKHVMDAECIVLLSAEDDAEKAADGVPVPPVPLFRIGTSPVGDTVFRRMIHLFAPNAQRHPHVINRLALHPEFADVDTLQGCILVKVATRDTHFAWLLAVNKANHKNMSSDRDATETADVSEYEFGTIEASLLNSAGIVLAAHARNVALFREKEAMLIGIVRALINAMDAKDPYTFGHSDRVAQIAKCIAHQMGQDNQFCERVFLTGLLHDIGKIGVSDAVLQKPGTLTDEEFAEIKKHPGIALKILQHVKQLEHVADGVLHHHESVDGRGYPGQLTGDAIPLTARIVAIADAYDAMTSNRAYRNAMPSSKAEAILRENSGVQWDTAAVDAFFEVLDEIKEICHGVDEPFRNPLLQSPSAPVAPNDSQTDSVAEAVLATSSYTP